MAKLPRGMVAAPTLDGIHLEHAPASTGIRGKDLRAVRETVAGRRRQQRTWWGEAALENPSCLVPLRRMRHEVTIGYENLRDERVEDRLAGGGPHEVVVWKTVTLAYRGDGVTREAWMPWRLALDVVTLPPGLTAAQVAAEPEVKIGYDGVVLTYVAKSTGNYAAGSPAAGEVWFEQGGQKFKLPSPPAAGGILLARVIPVLVVLNETDDEVQYTKDRLFVEPRTLLFRES